MSENRLDGGLDGVGRRPRRGRGGGATAARAGGCTHTLEPLEPRRLLSAVPGNMIASPLGEIATATGSGVPAGNTIPVGHTPAQIDTAYGINAIQFGSVAGTGAGQTIAIIVAYDNPELVDTGSAGFATSDLHRFDLAMGLADPPSFVKVDQVGGTDYPGTDPTGAWENESAMDVEWAHATAPAANILLVEANSDNLSDLIGGAVVYARQQPGVSVISMSFAATEAAQETTFDADLTTPPGHAGITFVAGTGDYGPPGNYPAFSPNVLAVGSTTLYTDSAGDYEGESGYVSSGGGISQYETKPAYQDLVATPSTTYRTIPDVAFDGDDTTGGAVYDSYNGGSAPWYEVGGTSFGAPNWAGMIAIADQGRALAGLAALDGPSQTLPRLYGLPASDFNDITTGQNTGSGGTTYQATVGYDLVTGRGTPIASRLVPDLAGGTAAVNGSVFLDQAGDGVWTVNDKPMVGWTVTLSQGSVVFSTTSASNGAFSFSQLSPGTYVAAVTLPIGFGQTLPATSVYTLNLLNGQAVTAVLFAARIAPTPSPPVATTAVVANARSASGDAGAGSVESAGEPSADTAASALPPRALIPADGAAVGHGAATATPAEPAAPLVGANSAALPAIGWASLWLDWISGWSWTSAAASAASAVTGG